MTLRPDDWKAWIAGAYFRGYGLMKGGRLREADALLSELESFADKHIPKEVLGGRIKRLHGEVLLGLNEPRGRTLILEVLRNLGGVNASIGEKEKERARLASDLARSLSSIGEHDKAIRLMQNVCDRPVRDRELAALRWSNLASWYNQRAVVHRAAGDRERARADLDQADVHINAALERREELTGKLAHDQTLELRECRAVALSIRIERAWLEPSDLPSATKDLRTLLQQTPDFDNAPETPLQLAFRVGRLGVANLRAKSPRSEQGRAIARACGYLRYAWEYSQRVPLRPWLALDLCEALTTHGQLDEARSVAAAALARLEAACPKNYPPSERLRELSGKRKPSRSRRARAVS